MKRFIYDTILDEENICNLSREKQRLLTAIEQQKKLVVYGPRNFGKTSLMHSVIVPQFRKNNTKSFVFQADLMEVRSMESLTERLRKAFERSFADSLPKQQMLETAKRFLLNLRPTIEIDPLTGQPSLSLGSTEVPDRKDIFEIFDIINDKIAPEYHTLIFLDEFQDVAFVDGAQGVIRQVFQRLQNVSVVLMGSKQHILSQIFAIPGAPLANFGEDLSFGRIPYDEYSEYINERFSKKKLELSDDISQKLQDTVKRIPEAINIICADLLHRLSNKKVGWEDVSQSILRVVEGRSARYQAILSQLSEKEERVLIAIENHAPVKHPTGKDFLGKTNVSNRAVATIVKSFHDSGLVEKNEDGYQINDPLLSLYIERYR